LVFHKNTEGWSVQANPLLTVAQWLKITKKSHFDVFKKSPKLTIFGNFDELFSTQNVNVARFARNFECDFLCDFQPL